ncbi:MAG TPA: shikimate dehydrogenase [Burkholderiales bacterium]|nr:shikimate dehydrogenase [Burkholderiales bacterium]
MQKLLLGLIGAGIQRSLSPALHEEEGAHHGLRVHYQIIDIEGAGAEALPALIRTARLIGFAGLNVTYPCKQSVIALLDGLSEDAKAIGAVNTVVRDGERLVGHNTDGSGWAWGFCRALPRADLRRVVLLGAGGAGSACADAVLRLGARDLVVVDRDHARAEDLASRLKRIFSGRTISMERDVQTALPGASGLIHATPTGMAGAPGMALPAELLRPPLWVSEVVYVPLETELLRAARRAGCEVMDGGHMTVGQAIGAFKLFTGLDADPGRMDAHFRQLVSASLQGGGRKMASKEEHP